MITIYNWIECKFNFIHVTVLIWTKYHIIISTSKYCKFWFAIINHYEFNSTNHHSFVLFIVYSNDTYASDRTDWQIQFYADFSPVHAKFTEYGLHPAFKAVRKQISDKISLYALQSLNYTHQELNRCHIFHKLWIFLIKQKLGKTSDESPWTSTWFPRARFSWS